ncbi:hypothetical protein AB0L88_14860 [Saccharopolyspora shandongensis]|uniref:hypothetical protein n=1 Tax=Saccharopolyspora shandongensis TaxID=418495 RepID=UPI00343386FB
MLIRSGGVVMIMFRRGLVRRSVAGPATSSAVGFFAVVAGMAPTAVAVWWSSGQVAGLVVLCLVAGGYGLAVRNATGALVTAALGWMLFNGFVVHSHGDLGWDSGDAVRLAALTGAALLGALLGKAWAARHERPVVLESIPAPRAVQPASGLAKAASSPEVALPPARESRPVA